MSNQRQRFDVAAEKVLLTVDERASLIILHEDTYEIWLRDGIGLEIKRKRLNSIMEVLELLATVLEPEAAHEWLKSRNTSMAPKIPAAVLRVGKVENVLAEVTAMAGEIASFTVD